MQVKKYRARTIKEASAKVKNVLGPDAMILSTKKISNVGENDIFEITALTGATNISDESPNMLGEVKQELMSIKEMLYLLNNSDVFIEKLITYPGVLSLYTKMIKNGVNDRYIRLFFEKTGAFNGHPVNDMKSIKGMSSSCCVWTPLIIRIIILTASIHNRRVVFSTLLLYVHASYHITIP